MSKILYVFEAADIASRLPVAKAARANGHEVILALIGGDKKIEDFETALISKRHHAFGLFALTDILSQMNEIIKAHNPDILHVVTLKYAFIAAMASLRRSRMRKIYTLAGLGYLFHAEGTKARFLQSALRPVLGFLFRRQNTKLVFQNPDDLALFTNLRCADKSQCILIRGSGVDLSRFQLSNTPPESPPIVLMPTRLVQEKGIGVFIEAAKILHAQGINARFQIAGGESAHNPRSISAQDMRRMIEDSPVEWLGRVENIPELLARAALVVYPSYYGEGIPRVLLEACAAGRAIVTTDHTGCREAVDDGKNGILVPVKNPQDTANAILDILKNDDLRYAMEKHSRTKAEAEFDIQKIAAQTARLYTSE